MKRKWIDQLFKQKPTFKNFETLRNDYVWLSFKEEANVEMSIGVGKRALTARFLLRGSMKKYLDAVARDLEKAVDDSVETTFPEGTDRATAIVKLPFDLSDTAKWPGTFDWADEKMRQFLSFFQDHRRSFRTGRYP